MKTKLIMVSAIYCLLTMACQSADKKQESSKDSLAVNSAQENSKPYPLNENIDNEEADEKLFDELLIKGKDIWVRDAPITGQVVMKLNEGDKCRILQKSELSLAKGLPDYWYKIEFNNQKGWVFGSQTSIALFVAVQEPFAGNLMSCSDEIVRLSETPASYSYTFKHDLTFIFSVAAGYTITGKYSWSGSSISLSSLKLTVSSPDGNVSQSLSGTINFSVYRKDEIICLVEKENKLTNKEYAPKGGCFCSE